MCTKALYGSVAALTLLVLFLIGKKYREVKLLTLAPKQNKRGLDTQVKTLN